MKKWTLFFAALALVFGLCGCDTPPSGGGNSEITGSIVYFFGDSENAIDTFWSESDKAKEISLFKNKTYTVELRPSFRGSKEAVYIGDCATFSFPDGCCEITYAAEPDAQPVYELVILTDDDFDLTVRADGYVQTIKILVTPPSVDKDPLLPQFYFDAIHKLKISDIQRVERAEYAGSVSPIHRDPVKHTASTLATDIETVYLWLKGLEGNLTPSNLPIPEGGSSLCLTLTTSIGTLEIWQDADGYLTLGENRYSQNGKMPILEGETVTYTFESYYDNASIYFDGIQIGTADFPFESIVCEKVDAQLTDRLFWMNTCIGMVEVYGRQYFTRGQTSYKIIDGPDFSGIIDKFFCAFDESDAVTYTALHDSHPKDYGNDNHLYPAVYVFDELDNFQKYCDSEGLTRVRDRVDSLVGKKLIVVEFTTGSSADSCDVANVGVSGEMLTVCFTQTESGADGMTADWVHYAIIIVDEENFNGDAENVRLLFDFWRFENSIC